MEKVFEALASTPRRKILAYLSEVDLTAGEIASRFEMSKPAISKHLQILENAGLVTSTKQGQFVRYPRGPNNPVNPLNGFAQHVSPVPTPPRRKSAKPQKSRSQEPKGKGREMQRGRGPGGIAPDKTADPVT